MLLSIIYSITTLIILYVLISGQDINFFEVLKYILSKAFLVIIFLTLLAVIVGILYYSYADSLFKVKMNKLANMYLSLISIFIFMQFIFLVVIDMNNTYGFIFPLVIEILISGLVFLYFSFTNEKMGKIYSVIKMIEFQNYKLPVLIMKVGNSNYTMQIFLELSNFTYHTLTKNSKDIIDHALMKQLNLLAREDKGAFYKVAIPIKNKGLKKIELINRTFFILEFKLFGNFNPDNIDIYEHDGLILSRLNYLLEFILDFEKITKKKTSFISENDLLDLLYYTYHDSKKLRQDDHFYEWINPNIKHKYKSLVTLENYNSAVTVYSVIGINPTFDNGFLSKVLMESKDYTVKLSFKRRYFEEEPKKINKDEKWLRFFTKRFSQKIHDESKNIDRRSKNKLFNNIIDTFYSGGMTQDLFNVGVEIIYSRPKYSIRESKANSSIFGSNIVPNIFTQEEALRRVMLPISHNLKDKTKYLKLTYPNQLLTNLEGLASCGIFSSNILNEHKNGIYLGENIDEINVNKLDEQDYVYNGSVFVDMSKYHTYWGSDYKINSTEESNGNMLVLGKSGMGKTYFIDSLIPQKQKLGHMIVIFDLEDSYSKFDAIYTQGFVYDLNDDNIVINPFDVHKSDINSYQEALQDHKDFLVRFFKLLLGIGLAGIDETKDIYIKQLIDELYNNYGINGNSFNETIVDFPLLSDLLKLIKLKINKLNKIEESLKSKTLKEFYASFYQQLDKFLEIEDNNTRFNSYTTINTDNLQKEYIRIKIPLKSTEKPSKEKKLSIILVLNYIDQVLFGSEADSPNTQGKFIVFDEAHRFFKLDDFDSVVELITVLAKQGRKRFLELCLATQNIEDLTTSKYKDSSAQIIDNCAYKVLFNIGNKINYFIDDTSEDEQLYIKTLSKEYMFFMQGNYTRTKVHVKRLPWVDDVIHKRK